MFFPLRRLGAAVAALAVATGAALAAPAPALAAPPGSIGIRLLDAPANRADDPRAALYVVDHVAGGATIERRIEVSNGTAAPVPLSLYAAGAEVSGGVFGFVPGREGNELSRWTSVDRPQVTVAPGGAEIATVTVRIPPDATPGERYAVVWAEAAGTPGTGGVTRVSRVGVRMYVSVGDGEEPVSDFVVSTLTARRDAGGRPVVEAAVRNTGGRALDVSGELHLTDGPGGTAAGPFPVELGTTLAPADAAPVTVTLDPELPAGPWDARLVLRSGRLEGTATATITFPAGPGAAAQPVVARMSPVERREKVLMPVAHGLLLAVVFGLLLFWWKRRRDDEDDDARAAPARPAVVRH